MQVQVKVLIKMHVISRAMIMTNIVATVYVTYARSDCLYFFFNMSPLFFTVNLAYLYRLQYAHANIMFKSIWPNAVF